MQQAHLYRTGITEQDDGLPQVNHDNKLSLDNNLLVLGFGGVRFEADICLVACGAVVIPKSVRDHKQELSE